MAGTRKGGYKDTPTNRPEYDQKKPKPWTDYIPWRAFLFCTIALGAVGVIVAVVQSMSWAPLTFWAVALYSACIAWQARKSQKRTNRPERSYGMPLFKFERELWRDATAGIKQYKAEKRSKKQEAEKAKVIKLSDHGRKSK